MSKEIELSKEDFRKMQLIELDLLKEFDRVSDEGNKDELQRKNQVLYLRYACFYLFLCLFLLFPPDYII